MRPSAESYPEDEAALVVASQRGDHGAFERLVLRHQRRAYALALRLLDDAADAADVTQEAFVRAYRGLAGFRGEVAFSTWLFRIIVTLCHSRRRLARHRPVVAASLEEPIGTADGQLMIEPEDPELGSDIQAAGAELAERLAQALRQLDSPHRTVIILRDVQGLTYDEIADILRCEVGTVKSRLNRARTRLRALLQGVV